MEHKSNIDECVYITFRWYSCKMSGTETVKEQNYEAQKRFLREVFGAYRFEIIEKWVDKFCTNYDGGYYGAQK